MLFSVLIFFFLCLVTTVFGLTQFLHIFNVNVKNEGKITSFLVDHFVIKLNWVSVFTTLLSWRKCIFENSWCYGYNFCKILFYLAYFTKSWKSGFWFSMIQYLKVQSTLMQHKGDFEWNTHVFTRFEISPICMITNTIKTE